MSGLKVGGLAIITGSLSVAGQANVGRTVELVERVLLGEKTSIGGRPFHATSATAWVVKAEGLVSRARMANGESWYFTSNLSLPAESHLIPIGDDPDKVATKDKELELS